MGTGNPLSSAFPQNLHGKWLADWRSKSSWRSDVSGHRTPSLSQMGADNADKKLSLSRSPMSSQYGSRPARSFFYLRPHRWLSSPLIRGMEATRDDKMLSTPSWNSRQMVVDSMRLSILAVDKRTARGWQKKLRSISDTLKSLKFGYIYTLERN